MKPKNLGCPAPGPGWWCSRTPGHTGPCAARPRVWNLRAYLRWRRNY